MMEIYAGSEVDGLSQLVKLKLGNYVKCDHLKSCSLKSLSMDNCMLKSDRVFDSPIDLPSLDSLRLVLWTESEKSGKDWQAGGPKSQLEKKVCLVCLLDYTTLVYGWWDLERILKIPIEIICTIRQQEEHFISWRTCNFWYIGLFIAICSDFLSSYFASRDLPSIEEIP